MLSFLLRLFGKAPAKPVASVQEPFSARFHRFKLFLSAYVEAYSEMMNFEERLAAPYPVGMPFLRVCSTKLSIATMQCIMQLNSLGDKKFGRLMEPFSQLRTQAEQVLSSGAEPLVGPSLVMLDEITEEHTDIIAHELIKLEPIRQAYPEFIPSGFVITGAAWWDYFNNPEMHEEIDRIMLISQDDPASYEQAAATIRDRLLESFPLPETLKVELEKALEDVKEDLAEPGWTLLVRSLPVRLNHRALVLPEQVIKTPIINTQVVYEAIAKALAMTYRPRAMIYRLKLGIRDRAMPFCICFSVLPEEQGRGSAHRKLDSLQETELIVHLRRVLTSPDGGFIQADSATMADDMKTQVTSKCEAALVCVADAPVVGNRHEIYWAAASNGDFFVVGVCALPDPVNTERSSPAATSCSLQGATGQWLTFPLCGGLSTYPGKTKGKAVVVRNLRDAMQFPIGGILVVSQASPRWTFLLDFAAGAIAGDGSGTGFFAQTARRYGRPTILGQPNALELLGEEQEIVVVSSEQQDCAVMLCPSEAECASTLPLESIDEAEKRVELALPKEEVCSLCQETEAKQAALPSATNVMSERGNLWLSTSPIANIVMDLAPIISKNTLVDADDPDFRAENCKSFHDFLTYSHDHAVREIFRHSTSRKTALAPAKQLVCDVPKQFWIIDLGDGFYGDVTTSTVKLEQIASLPMRTLWEGFSDKPWDGPPQINAKGFLSVLFEATQNPNLDPASQHSEYAEKNVFLVAKSFCSMRCRFGFHFLSLDSFLSDRPRERFIVFHFKGGAANLARRIKRVHFVADLLQSFDFSTDIVGDTLTARLEETDERTFLSALRVIGYLVMHTRQLDMIMADDQALAQYRFRMLEDLMSLAARPPLILPQ